MSEQRRLHRGHMALLGYIKDGETRTAYARGGMVQIDGVTQDFLEGWYEELKHWSLISATDKLGRSGAKLGEEIEITDQGLDVLQQAQTA